MRNGIGKWAGLLRSGGHVWPADAFGGELPARYCGVAVAGWTVAVAVGSAWPGTGMISF